MRISWDFKVCSHRVHCSRGKLQKGLALGEKFQLRQASALSQGPTPAEAPRLWPWVSTVEP